MQMITRGSQYIKLIFVLFLGFLVWFGGPAVVAQDDSGNGASKSIDITDEAKSKPDEAKAAEPEIQPISRANIKISDRDPFQNPIASGWLRRHSKKSTKVKTVHKAAPESETTSNKEAKASSSEPEEAITNPDEEQEEEVSAPAVTVTGIVLSPKGHKAILKSEDDQGYIVSVGDKLADYKVIAITDRAVTFKVQDHTFTLELEDEWGLHGK